MHIRVKITRDGSNIIESVPFFDYLCGVVPAEMVANAHPEAYKAQAVAAATYALHKIQARATEEYDVDDTSKYQAYIPDKVNAAASAAVRAVYGEVLYYDGNLLEDCVYSDANGGHTVSALKKWGKSVPYLISQFDPYTQLSGKPRNGHGVGMSQWGAEYAARRGLDYKKILEFYYPRTYITKEFSMIPEIKVHILTENDSYKNQRPMIPDGIMVHSTASPGVMAMRKSGKSSPFIERWNAPGTEKSVHAFIDDVDIVQALPWDIEGMHSGKGSKSSAYSANRSYIGFEICEPAGHYYKTGGIMYDYDAAAQESYFKAVWDNAISLCVYLCQKFGIHPDRIICHSEGHTLGIASNHSDVMQWFPKHGKNMDIFREEVKRIMGIQTDKGYKPFIVNTVSSPLNVRNEPNGEVFGSFAKGESVLVDKESDGWSHAQNMNGKLVGWVASKYLLAVEEPEPTEPEPPEEPEQPSEPKPDYNPVIEAIESVIDSMDIAIEALKNAINILKL